MIDGRLAIDIDDGEDLEFFCRLLTMLRANGTLPKELQWSWEAIPGGWQLDLYGQDEDGVSWAHGMSPEREKAVITPPPQEDGSPSDDS